MEKIKFYSIITIIIVLLIGCTSTNEEPTTDKVILEYTEIIADLEATNYELTSYNTDCNKEIDNYIQKIEVLESSLIDCEEEILAYKNKEELQIIRDNNYPILANLSLDFVRAHTSGDIDKLQELVSEEIEFYFDNEDIYCRYKNSEEPTEFPVYIMENEPYYRDMVIHGYGYIEENMYLIHIKEFATLDSPYGNGAFLNLSFMKIDGYWKVVKIEFDI